MTRFDSDDWAFVSGIRRLPDVTMEISMQRYDEALTALAKGTKVVVSVFGDEYDCYVTRVAPCANFDHRYIDVTLKPTGAPRSNCRCATVPAISKRKPPMKIRNKFYVAAPSVTKPSEQDQDNIDPAQQSIRPSDASMGKQWTRKDLKAAVEHATALLEADPKLEHVAISRIVTLVRRKKAPVVVEQVK